MKRNLFFITAIIVAMLFNACDKGSIIVEDDLFLVDDEAFAETMFDDVFSSVDIATILLEEAVKADFAKGNTISINDTCPAVTVDIPDEGTWPKVITIDYGDGCTIGEVIRKGKIIISVTGPRYLAGASRSVTFDEYSYNGYSVAGTKTITNEVRNDDENPVITVTLEGGMITLPGGETIEREFVRQREWITGSSTPWFIWDDEWLITGEVSGKTVKGVRYTNSIVVPLHRKRVCRFVVSGVVTFERDDRETVELDYGDGECDAIAVLRRGDEEKEVRLGMNRE